MPGGACARRAALLALRPCPIARRSAARFPSRRGQCNREGHARASTLIADDRSLSDQCLAPHLHHGYDPCGRPDRVHAERLSPPTRRYIPRNLAAARSPRPIRHYLAGPTRHRFLSSSSSTTTPSRPTRVASKAWHRRAQRSPARRSRTIGSRRGLQAHVPVRKPRRAVPSSRRFLSRLSWTPSRSSTAGYRGGPGEQDGDLAAVEGVVAVQENRIEQPLTDVTPEFIGATAAWSQLGGSTTAGEGVIVGVLDTGIWPEHPSLADNGIDHPGGAYGCEFGDGTDRSSGLHSRAMTSSRRIRVPRHQPASVPIRSRASSATTRGPRARRATLTVTGPTHPPPPPAAGREAVLSGPSGDRSVASPPGAPHHVPGRWRGCFQSDSVARGRAGDRR